MSNAYAVLLRGINVGRGNRLAMADLRRWLTDAGFADVRTLLNSGNIVLRSRLSDPERVAEAVSDLIHEHTGKRLQALARTAAQLQQALRQDPLMALVGNESRHQLIFLSGPLPSSFPPGCDQVDPGRVALGERVIYQWCPDGISNAPSVVELVGRQLGLGYTARNRSTVRKLLAAMTSDDAT